MNDLRDPAVLGETLLAWSELDNRDAIVHLPLSEVYDANRRSLRFTPRHNANPSPLEKYGDPREQGERWERDHAHELVGAG